MAVKIYSHVNAAVRPTPVTTGSISICNNITHNATGTTTGAPPQATQATQAEATQAEATQATLGNTVMIITPSRLCLSFF